MRRNNPINLNTPLPSFISFLILICFLCVCLIPGNVFASIGEFVQIEAEDYDDTNSLTVQTYGLSNGYRVIGSLEPGDYLVYNNIDFGTGLESFRIKLALGGSNPADIEIRAGSSTGTLLGTLSVSPTGGWDTYQEFTCSIDSITGINDIYIICVGYFNIDWFMFLPEGSTIRSAFSKIECEDFDSTNSSTVQTFDTSDGQIVVGSIESGDYLAFDNVDLGTGISIFRTNIAYEGSTSAKIEIRSGSSSGTLLGTLPITSTGNLNTYREFSCSIDSITGLKSIYIVYSGSFNADWFFFESIDTKVTDAFSQIEAENYNSTNSSTVQIYGMSSSVKFAGSIEPNDYLLFDNVNLSTGASSLRMNVAYGGSTPADIEIRSGSADGPLLGTIAVSSTGGWDIYQEFSCSLDNITGVHDICVVYLGYFNSDWFMFSPTIPKSETIDAFSQIENESYDSANSSSLQIYGASNGRKVVGSIQTGNYLVYNNINFGSGASSFRTYVAYGGSTSAKIEIRLGSSTGTLLGTLTVLPTGDWDTYQEFSCSIDSITDVNNIYIVYLGYFNTDWFMFSPSEPPTETKDAFSQIEYEAFNSTNSSIIQKIYIDATRKAIGSVQPGNYTVYKNIDFGTGASLFRANIGYNISTDANIEIRLGSSTGVLLGTLTVSSTGGWNTYQEFSCSIDESITGLHNVYMVYTGYFNADWFMFTPAEPSSETIDAFSQIENEAYDSTNSSTLSTFYVSRTGKAIGYIETGNYTVYNNIDFDTGATMFRINASYGGSTPAIIEIRDGSSTGPVLGSLSIPPTGSWNTYQEYSCAVENITGVHNIYLVYLSSLNADWFMFTPSESPVTVIDAFSKIECETFDSTNSSNIQTIPVGGGGNAVGYIYGADYLVFKNVDFGSGALSFKAKVACNAGSSVDVQLRLGSSTGPLLGVMQIPSLGSWTSYHEISCNVTNAIGTENLYLLFTGPVNVDWLIFDTSSAIPETIELPDDPSVAYELNQPEIYLSRNANSTVEIGSINKISLVQIGFLNTFGLGKLVGQKEIVILLDNSATERNVFEEIRSPLDYGIFARRNFRGLGNSSKVLGDIHANNLFESYISNLVVSGKCSASQFTFGYGTNTSCAGMVDITETLEMPVFHQQFIDEASANSLVFDPANFTPNTNYPFPGQPGFNIRLESGNTFLITGSGTFNISSSMHFKGNLRISVPYTANTGNNFLVADGFVKLEGRNVNPEILSEEALKNNTNKLNIYSIHGNIWVATENSNLYGILYAAGITGNPLYPYDCGDVIIQGINNDLYGSVVAGNDVRLEGSFATVHCTSESNSIIEKNFLPSELRFSARDAAKQLIDKFAGTNTKICVLQYSDSANANDFNFYNVSEAANVSALKTAIDNIPVNTSNSSNMGDGLRRAYQMLNDTQSSPSATKYIVSLSASSPNKWTSNEEYNTSINTSFGDAFYISGDGTDSDNQKALDYTLAMGNIINSADIETIIIDNSTEEETSSKIEQIALTSGAQFYNTPSLDNLATLYSNLFIEPAKNITLDNIKYEEIFPAKVKIIEAPDNFNVSIVEIDGVSRYKLSGTLNNIKLNYIGTKYHFEPFSFDVKVQFLDLGIVPFLGDNSKVTYDIEYVNSLGEVVHTYCNKKLADLFVDVKLTIDVD